MTTYDKLLKSETELLKLLIHAEAERNASFDILGYIQERFSKQLKATIMMETKDIEKRKKQLEAHIAQLIIEFERDTDILTVDKIYVSNGTVRTELKVKL